MRRLLAIAALCLAAPNPAHAGTTIVLDGRGWGHGVGMSQYGARGFAQRGWSYERILAYYYRGTTLGTLPNRSVRVLVAEGKARVVLGSATAFRRIAAGKRKTVRGDKGLTARALARLGGHVRYEPGASPLRVDGSPFRGSIEVYAEGRRLFAVNEVSLDHYLRGVVPWEMPDEWPQQALRAQAVVARSYTLATYHPGDRFDLYADTRDQVYGGIRAESPTTNAAVAATAGRVVLWQGRVATTYYHSTSGGRTAYASDLWPDLGSVPYLVPVPDPYDRFSPVHHWPVRYFTPVGLGRTLRVGALRDVVVTRSRSGRAASVRLAGKGGARVLTAKEFRDALGLRSTWFTLEVLSLQAERARVRRGRPVELTGRVRGATQVRLEKAVGTRGWAPVRRPRIGADGRFRTVVRPLAATRYRIVTDVAAGPVVSVVTQ